MTRYDRLTCPDGDRCRHLWGACDCVVCTEKREAMIDRGNAMLRDYLWHRFQADRTGEQATLPYEPEAHR